MKKKGYNHLQMPNGIIFDGPLVVVCDDLNVYRSWHTLQGEEAFVEWVGGTFKL